MITFKKIRYKNLLSSGNQFTEIDFTSAKTTLVVGKNGAGKSTFLDALSYVLYNKAFRNVNKPQLVNSITQKGLLVEVEFSVSGRNYLVSRGQKPNVFEIYQDGTLINQAADNRDYQAMLEQNIVKMNHRSFRQIVVLGSADFMPFMQLPAQARREVIEDLLDIQVFSVMNALLKTKIAKNKDDITEIDHKIAMAKSIIELEERHLEELRQNNEELITDKQKKIAEYETENTQLFEKQQELSKENESLQQSLDTTIEDKHAEAITLRKKFADTIKKYDKQIKFFQENDNCPTCEQTISEEFKTNRLETVQDRKQQKETGLVNLDNTIHKIEVKVQLTKKLLEKIQVINNKIRDINVKINTNLKFIQSIHKDIEVLQENKKTLYTERENATTKNDLLEYVEKRQAYISDRETLGVAASLLKDGGIKAKIISQYVPIMNKLINKYLSMMEFYVDFQLDENFKETLLSRARDDFTYASFSQGEKTRLDLSILLTWRTIAKMRNSAATNLLIFDEIFDSSVDTSGIENLLKVLGKLNNDNIFIISHTLPEHVDFFDNIIKFEKIKNFSRMV